MIGVPGEASRNDSTIPSPGWPYSCSLSVASRTSKVELAAVLRAGGDEHGARNAVQEAAGLHEREDNLAAIALIGG